jgi:hypothetical protein
MTGQSLASTQATSTLVSDPLSASMPSRTPCRRLLSIKPVSTSDGYYVTRQRFYQNRKVPRRKVFQWGDTTRRKVRQFMVPQAVAEAEGVMSRHSLKTASYDTFMANARIIRPYWRRVQAFYGSVSHRSRRLVWDARRRSGMAYTLNVVVDGHRNGMQNVVIAFGAGFRNRRSQHGEQHGPCPGKRVLFEVVALISSLSLARLRLTVTGVIRHFARFVRVVMTDEYRTSKVCCACANGVMRYGANLMATCSNAACASEARDRDTNGAENIKRVLKQLATDGTRPGLMARGTTLPDDSDDE